MEVSRGHPGGDNLEAIRNIALKPSSYMSSPRERKEERREEGQGRRGGERGGKL